MFTYWDVVLQVTASATVASDGEVSSTLLEASSSVIVYGPEPVITTCQPFA